MSVSMIFIHSAEMIPKIWSEIKRLVPGKNKHSHITCDISANDFKHHFANFSNKINSTFQNFDDFFSGKAQKVSIVFVSRICLMKILKQIWDLYLINPTMVYWVWTSSYLENQRHIFLYHWQMWYMKSHKSDFVEQDWKNARVTHIYKDDGDINDENNYSPISVINHITKMIEPLVSYQIIDFLEEHSFISVDQSAYLKRHSTQTSLHRVIDDREW